MSNRRRNDARETRRLRRAVFQGGVALEGTRIRIGSHRLFYRVSRDEPREPIPLVLVHGLVVSGRYLIPVGEALARRYRVYIPDLPGFGNSSSPARVYDVPQLSRSLEAFMDALGIDGACLIGNSMGCQVVAEAASRREDLVRAVVLTGPTPDVGARSAARHLLRFARLLPREPLSYWPILALDLAQAGPRRAIGSFQALLSHRMPQRLRQVGCPALVVRGTRDPIVSQEWAELAARLLPRGMLHVIPRAGHVVNYDSPVQLARATHEFLQRSVLGRRPRKGRPVADGAPASTLPGRQRGIRL